MEDNNEGVKEIAKGGSRTKASVRKAIEGELTEVRVKEARARLKQLIGELATAKKVVLAKEAEIETVFEDFADVIEG